MAQGYNRLRGKIVEVFGTQGAFADALGTTEQTITNKLAGKTQFSQNDIIAWCNALGIVTDDVGGYFFAQKLSNG